MFEGMMIIAVCVLILCMLSVYLDNRELAEKVKLQTLILESLVKGQPLFIEAIATDIREIKQCLDTLERD